MNGNFKKDIFTIPNILSYFRIALIPVFIVLFLNAKNGVGFHIGAIVVLVVSGLTDMLDGKIARKFNQITELGKIIDPLADKLTQFAVAVCLVLKYRLLIPVIVLLVIKEITMAVLAVVFARKGRKLKGAHWYGKLSTAVFYGVMFILLAVPYTKMPFALSAVLIGLSGACMLLAFVMYVRQYVVMWEDIRADRPNRRY